MAMIWFSFLLWIGQKFVLKVQLKCFVDTQKNNNKKKQTNLRLSLQLSHYNTQDTSKDKEMLLQKLQCDEDFGLEANICTTSLMKESLWNLVQTFMDK